LEKLTADLKKKAFALESTEALLTKAKDENKQLQKERDCLAREASEYVVAKNRAEGTLRYIFYIVVLTTQFDRCAWFIATRTQR
jgi:hypothetical protein